jgi:hypothetical protein
MKLACKRHTLSWRPEEAAKGLPTVMGIDPLWEFKALARSTADYHKSGRCKDDPPGEAEHTEGYWAWWKDTANEYLKAEGYPPIP